MDDPTSASPAIEQAQQGALARVTPERRRAALAAAAAARVFDLGVELSSRIPMLSVMRPFTVDPYLTPEKAREGGSMGDVSAHVEAISGSFHMSTHIDALVHFQHHGRIYGGHAMEDARDDQQGWKIHGIDSVAPIVGPGVLLDVAGVLGRDPLPDGYAITVDDLKRTLDAQGITLEAGDLVLVRTGKIRQFLVDNTAFGAGCPGLSSAAARWLYDQGMALFGLDATSADPQPEDWRDTAHVALLVERGVLIIENLFLEELAREHIYRFLFICAPLKIRGATGSWVRPLALA